MHIAFDRKQLEPVIAHDGNSPILWTRAATRGRGTHCNFIDCTIVPPGSEIGVHTHTLDNEELYIIIAGHAAMTVDGEEFDVGPGDVVVNRPGGTHGLRNLSSSSELHLVVVEVQVEKPKAD